MTHAEIIEKLGDYTGIAVALGEPGKPLPIGTTSVWKSRGVPWKYRPALARLAKSKGVLLPADFLAPL